MRPLASPRNHARVKKAGDRIQFCPLRKTGFSLGAYHANWFTSHICIKRGEP